MNEWNIQSRAHACAGCGQQFADKQAYRTLLLEQATELRRSDVCEPCAQKTGDARGQTGFISQWHGVYQAPLALPVEAIQKDTAETILRKLVEQNDPRYAPAAYILAVMLERKRLLKVKEQLKRDGRRIFVYEQPKTGDIFAITDPNLRLDQLEAVQRDVAQLLEHGLPAPVVEVMPPASEPVGVATTQLPEPVSVTIYE
jgi:hypothetical protein